MAQVLGKRRAMVTDILLHCLLLAVVLCCYGAMGGQLKLGGAVQKCLSQQGVSPGAEDAAALGAVLAACNCAPGLQPMWGESDLCV